MDMHELAAARQPGVALGRCGGGARIWRRTRVPASSNDDTKAPRGSKVIGLKVDPALLWQVTCDFWIIPILSMFDLSLLLDKSSIILRLRPIFVIPITARMRSHQHYALLKLSSSLV